MEKACRGNIMTKPKKQKAKIEVDPLWMDNVYLRQIKEVESKMKPKKRKALTYFIITSSEWYPVGIYSRHSRAKEELESNERGWVGDLKIIKVREVLRQRKV